MNRPDCHTWVKGVDLVIRGAFFDFAFFLIVMVLISLVFVVCHYNIVGAKLPIENFCLSRLCLIVPQLSVSVKPYDNTSKYVMIYHIVLYDGIQCNVLQCSVMFFGVWV